MQIISVATTYGCPPPQNNHVEQATQKYWKRLNKNPQKKQTDYIDWIELIPFKETRNYVQRVLENYNVYRYVLSQKPIYLKDFFKNNPLY